MIGFVKSKSGLQDTLRKRPSNEQAQQWKLPVAGLAGITNYNSVSGDVNLDQTTDRAHLGETLDSQAFGDWVMEELASMDAEERRIAGFDHLESRFANGHGNKTYDRSYPSTTSGRIEDDEQGPIEPNPLSETMNRVRTGNFKVTSTQSTQAAEGASGVGAVMPAINYERTHKYVDSGTSYPMSKADHSAIPRSIPSTPTARGKRKAPTDVPLVQAPEIQKYPLVGAANGPITAFSASERLVPAPSNGTSANESLDNHKSPSRQFNMPVRESVCSAPDEQFEGEDVHTREAVYDQLDYEEKELYAMDFAALKEEPFDREVGDDSCHVPNDGSSTSFEDRLQRMANMSNQDQQCFFASLNSAEREEAGAWFTERFREVTKKLDKIRADRRELALGFEEEIARRQKAVAQETFSIDATLREMKTKGVMVLTQKRK